MPVYLREWLPDDHLVFLVSDVADTLDISGVYASYERAARGQPLFDPRMVVTLVVYAYTVGIPSSRRIERKTYEDLAFRVLTADHHPDHDTICEFRKTHREALGQLFVQVLAVCREAGLVKLGHVALDGTKVKANASKHKAMSYARTVEKGAALGKEVEELLRKAQEQDDDEDARYGKGRRGDEVPEELRSTKPTKSSWAVASPTKPTTSARCSRWPRTWKPTPARSPRKPAPTTATTAKRTSSTSKGKASTPTSRRAGTTSSKTPRHREGGSRRT